MLFEFNILVTAILFEGWWVLLSLRLWVTIRRAIPAIHKCVVCSQYQSDCFQNRRPSRIFPKTPFRRWSPYRIQKGYLCHLQWDKWSRRYHRWLSLAKLVPWEGNKYAATSTRAWLRTYCAWPNLGVGCELICLLENIWEGIVAHGKKEPDLANAEEQTF